MTNKDFHHPFQPYDVQQRLMEALYTCIEEGKVGIFESPTGTGKSLSLICASLTWLREHKRKAFDESIAAIVLDDDEPEWMLEHARTVRRQEMQQTRADLEARLAAAREQERGIKARSVTNEPLAKRRKIEKDTQDSGGEDQFVLDDYVGDQPNSLLQPDGGVNSTKTTALLEQLGISKTRDRDALDTDYDELKIFLCSRTHSQLSQVVGELRRVRLPQDLPLPPAILTQGAKQETESVKQISLGSRQTLCINPRVSKLGDAGVINERCMELQQSSTPKEQRCRLLPSKGNEASVLDFRDYALAKIRDIEDLARLGTRLGICPYYSSRSVIGPAEVVTLPYPLLLQRSAREALGISLKGHVVIIDEAHNLMNALEGIHSSQISDTQLIRAKECLMVYLQKFRNRLKGGNRMYLAQIIRVIDSILLAVTNVKSQALKSGTITPRELLTGKGVDQVDLPKLVQYISESKLARKVDGYIAHINQVEHRNAGYDPRQQSYASKSPSLTQVQNFITTLTNASADGRFFWADEADCHVIKYMLLDPSTHFREIVEEARAVILAGGTMSPMDDYKQQLFPYLESLQTFSCGHLIPTSSLLVRTITSDHQGSLDFSFKSRALTSTADRVGVLLEDLACQVSGGLVVFFPSYAFLDQMCAHWRRSGFLTRLGQLRPIFLDQKHESAETVFQTYSDAITEEPSHSAILLSVLGGKLSEGINFSDNLGRCVVVVGLPFPDLNTPEWKARLEFINNSALARGDSKGNASKAHAENTCMRSVNQAIGRVIRHKDDWAGIVLVDGRYKQQRIRDKLPGWIKACFPADAQAAGWTVAEATKDVGHFFQTRNASA